MIQWFPDVHAHEAVTYNQLKGGILDELTTEAYQRNFLGHVRGEHQSFKEARGKFN